MLRLGHPKTICLLTILALGPWAGGSVYAHDGSADPRPGLSEAGRRASGVPVGVGPIRSLSGWFHVIYGDAPSGSGVAAISGYLLVDNQGQVTELLIDEQMLRGFGGPRVMNQRQVTVTGQRAVAPSPGGQSALSLLAVQTLQLVGPQPTVAAMAVAQAVTGPQPWATILCRFADIATTPHDVPWFNTLMLGTSAPGLDHYWRELSFNNVNLTGSAVYGWYKLPQPRSYYVFGNPEQLDHARAANDCTAVADGDVSFPSFVGINLMFNDDLDGFAWGGSWTLTRDGVSKVYRMTWVPPWGYENQGPIAHEMGHGFGLPHSSGSYSATYDSRWDVMSDILDNCPPFDPTYGCVGPHTIAYHKDLLGWIPSTQKYVAAPGTSQTIVMERLGQPTSGTSYLMALLPIGGSTSQFYTVEVRRFAGYDGKLPGEAVVIHRVDTTRSDRDAQVVDNDGNGNPNDASAMWRPGETFVDSTNGLSVAVNAQTATGFQLTITSGATGTTFRLDFDGDGKNDTSVYRDGVWKILRSSDGSHTAVGWGGLAQDILVPGDYDGDGKTDIAVYRDGVWYIRRSSDGGVTTIGLGGLGQDLVVPGDYDGDGKTDVAVYRGGMWYIVRSSDGSQTAVGWGGLAEDIPVPGDYDGDGKTDIAVYRDGVWYIRRSSDGGVTTIGWGGLAQDLVVPGDYDGDGKTDVAVYRGGMWYIVRSSDGSQTAVGWGGLAEDIPVPGDYDGDGKTDIAVYRTGVWYIRRSSDGGVTTTQWGGQPQDIPLN